MPARLYPVAVPGFTLVELLVVISIIAVLLALLTPALDQAVYQAELAVCAANQRNVVMGANAYAMESKRFYPKRDALQSTAQYRRPNLVRAGSDADDMTRLGSYVTWKMLFDPLNGGLNEGMIQRSLPTTNIYANYNLWWDWRYVRDSEGKASTRMGQVFSWNTEDFDVLVSEEDMAQLDTRTHCSHQDALGSQSLEVVQDGVVLPSTSPTTATETLSRWRHPNSARRAPIDANYGFQDGAVRRITEVKWWDDRLSRTPDKVDRGSGDIYIQIPSR
jgi:prepilin-type N-terminal cleavage/methylation domain-containing protein